MVSLMDYKNYLEKNNLKNNKENKKDYNCAEKVAEAFTRAKNHRENSCYWGLSADSETGGISADWSERWDKQEKIWMGWYRPIGKNGSFQSNVKSPMTTGRIESTLQKLEKVNIEWSVIPTLEEDEEKARICESLLRYFFAKNHIKEAITTIQKSILIHGTAFARVYFQKDEREYTYRKESSKDLDEDEMKEVKGMKEDDDKVEYLKEHKWGKKEKKLKYNDIVIEPIPIRDMYIDPGARCLHGNAFEAKYAIYRRVVNIEDFKQEFKNDPDAKNVDKVKPVGKYSDTTEEPFYQSHDLDDNDRGVVILEYENQAEDRYVVMANDIVIKDTPLPYDHKRMSFIRFYGIEFPYQLYGIGLPDFLENQQSAEEILLNMMYDYIYRTLHVTTFIEDQVYGEVTRSFLEADSQFVPVSTQGKPIGAVIQPMQNAPIGFDAFRLLDYSDQNATKKTQIDPSQMNLIQSNITATATAINKENTDGFINSLLQHFSMPMATMGEEVYSLMQQYYTAPRIEQIAGDDGKKKAQKRYRVIRVDGMKISEYDPLTDELVEEVGRQDGKKYSIKIEKIEGSSYFELQPSYLETEGEFDITIVPESLEVVSKGLEIQKSREAFAQLMPLAVDPRYPERVQQHPNPLVDAVKLMEWYVQKNEINRDILLDPGVGEKYEIETAQQDMLRIMEGMKLSGSPGRGRTHVQYEIDVMTSISDKIATLEQQQEDNLQAQAEAIEAEMAAQEEKVRAEFGMLPPEQIEGMLSQIQPPEPQLDKTLEDEIQKWRDIEDEMAKHIEKDSMPLVMSSQAAMPPQPEMPPQQANMPQMPGMDGNMNLPMGPPEPSAGAPIPMPNQMQMGDMFANMGGMMPG